MHKLILTAAMVTLALGGAAACSNSSSTPSPTSQATTPADQTKEVCAEAVGVGNSAAATIKAKAAEAAAALSAGDQAKVLQITADLKKSAANWSAKLTELSNKPVKPELKDALNDGVAKINTFASSTTVPADAEAKLNEFSTKLTAACA